MTNFQVLLTTFLLLNALVSFHKIFHAHATLLVIIASYHNFTRMELAYLVMCNEGFYGDACQFFNDCPSVDVCGENGTCIDGNDSYSCRCDRSYKGDHYELIDDCLGVNCNDQGQCIDGDNSYTCICYAGSTGMNCEIDFNDCVSVSCSGQGQCVDGNGSYACVCNPGFTGEDCAINSKLLPL